MVYKFLCFLGGLGTGWASAALLTHYMVIPVASGPALTFLVMGAIGGCVCGFLGAKAD